MNLRELAKGKPCMVRLGDICNHNPETTVLAHYRLVGLSGIGMKSPDWIGAWACHACHDEVDGRTHKLDRFAARAFHAEGVFRTQAEIIKLGALKW